MRVSSKSSCILLLAVALAAPADGLGVLGPPLDGGSDEPSAARCAGVCTDTDTDTDTDSICSVSVSACVVFAGGACGSTALALVEHLPKPGGPTDGASRVPHRSCLPRAAPSYRIW